VDDVDAALVEGAVVVVGLGGLGDEVEVAAQVGQFDRGHPADQLAHPVGQAVGGTGRVAVEAELHAPLTFGVAVAPFGPGRVDLRDRGCQGGFQGGGVQPR